LRRAPHDRAVRAGVSLGLSLLVGLLLATPSLAAGAHLQPRIVGGTEAKIEDAPFQVALYDPSALSPGETENIHAAQFCGGVIRDATHIITAAHCVTFGGFEAAAPTEIEVFAGGNDLEHASMGTRDQVLATSFDPEWNPFTNEHDVGVLTLENPLWAGESPEIDGTSKIAPIEFAASDPLAGSSATVSGWGFTKALAREQEATPQEEIEGYPPTLKAAEVAIVDRAECSADYAEEEIGPFDQQFICAAGSEPARDSCFGDSGGPLFSGTPGKAEDRLLGLVDFGAGCAQEELPGVYQSVIEPRNRVFASSNPPQAPRNEGLPTIVGSLQAGQTVTCNPGRWLGAPEFFYRFYRDESTLLRPGVKALTGKLTSSASYTLQSADAGTRIFCEVVALNGGGRGEAIGEDASVAAAALPSAALPAPIVLTAVKVKSTPPLLAPTLRVASARCRRGACAVNVRVSKGAGAALVTTVEAKLSFTRRFACRKHRRRATCKRSITRKLSARRLTGERFSIIATGLRPSPYTMTLVAIDRAGLRQTHATKLALLLRAPHSAR
jgi:secreted trypsin-like serine protease